LDLKEQFGKYEFIKRLDVGGMAEIFLARYQGTDGFEKLVAIKRLLPKIAEDAKFTGMFINEAKIAADLDHGNIARIFDVGRIEGSYYIEMEYVHGKDLGITLDRLRNTGEALPIPAACCLMIQFCDGLQYAHVRRGSDGHRLSIVHRDISPQNILISYEGDVKIIDFGIAKAAHIEPGTKSGILKGKLGYMSPEQAAGGTVDARSDIFNTGIVLYEIVAGRRLFSSESDLSALEKIKSAEVTPPGRINVEVPRQIDRIVMKALKKQPEDRYQTIQELSVDLRHFMEERKIFFTRKELGALVRERFKNEYKSESELLERSGVNLSTFSSDATRTGGTSLEEGEKTVSGITEAGRLKPYDMPVTTERNIDVDKGFGPFMFEKIAALRKRFVFKWAYIAVISALLLAAGVYFSIHSLIKATGDLTIFVNPSDAKVFVGKDELKGASPFSIPDIRRGWYEIDVSHPGYEPHNEAVNVNAGEHKKLFVVLEEMKKVYGSLLIETVPAGAVVSIDGRPSITSSPIKIDSLAADIDHNIVIEKAGFSPARSVVRLKEDEVRTVRMFLGGVRSALTIKSNPSGAMIILDGKRVGQTPMDLYFLEPSRKYRLDLKRVGYRQRSILVTMQEGEEKTLEIELKRRGKNKPDHVR